MGKLTGVVCRNSCSSSVGRLRAMRLKVFAENCHTSESFEGCNKHFAAGRVPSMVRKTPRAARVRGLASLKIMKLENGKYAILHTGRPNSIAAPHNCRQCNPASLERRGERQSSGYVRTCYGCGMSQSRMMGVGVQQLQPPALWLSSAPARCGENAADCAIILARDMFIGLMISTLCFVFCLLSCCAP